MTTEFDSIGGYTLVYFIGRGGMGEVWTCVKPKTTSPYAIKILQPRLATSDDYPKMFRREAAIGAQLGRYRSIVAVHDYGEHVVPDLEGGDEARLLYLVMDIVDGVNLRQLIRQQYKAMRRRPPLRLVAHVARVVLRALDAAHHHQIGGQSACVVHGDINPGNVLISSHGEVSITDFGIARVAPGDTWISQPMGTLRYMAPEQLMGQVCPANDLYGVGGLIHEALTGRPPISVRGPTAQVQRALLEAPVESTGRDDLPPELERLRVALLEKRVEDRIQSAQEALDLLGQFSREDSEGDLRTLYREVIGPPTSGLTRYLQHEGHGGAGSFIARMAERRRSQLTSRFETPPRRPPVIVHEEPEVRAVDSGAPVPWIRPSEASRLADEGVPNRRAARPRLRVQDAEAPVDPTLPLGSVDPDPLDRGESPDGTEVMAPLRPADSDGVPIHFHRPKRRGEGLLAHPAAAGASPEASDGESGATDRVPAPAASRDAASAQGAQPKRRKPPTEAT
jgi:serine/threonine protein kinase